MAEKLRVAHAADKERAVADVRAEMQALGFHIQVDCRRVLRAFFVLCFFFIVVAAEAQHRLNIRLHD